MKKMKKWKTALVALVALAVIVFFLVKDSNRNHEGKIDNQIATLRNILASPNGGDVQESAKALLISLKAADLDQGEFYYGNTKIDLAVYSQALERVSEPGLNSSQAARDGNLLGNMPFLGLTAFVNRCILLILLSLFLFLVFVLELVEHLFRGSSGKDAIANKNEE